MQVLYVSEVVQSLQCIVGLVLLQTVVFVHKVVEAELVFAQLHLLLIAVIEQTDFVQQTEVQTVD
jgi:hypothetical protein